MATTTITVPNEYGYVVLAAAGTFFLGLWHGFRVPGFRRPAAMHYPKAYADSHDLAHAPTPEAKQAMYLFNCAQRAHANYGENQPSVTIALLLAGLHYPVASASVGALWLGCRLLYALGYTRADKTAGQGRLVGSGGWFCQLGLYGMATWVGWKMIM